MIAEAAVLAPVVLVPFGVAAAVLWLLGWLDDRDVRRRARRHLTREDVR